MIYNGKREIVGKKSLFLPLFIVFLFVYWIIIIMNQKRKQGVFNKS